MGAVKIFAPAKLNLFLAVTGRRSDGFHDLVSLVAPVDFGDELMAEEKGPEGKTRFTLECDVPAVPVDGTNLVLKAAESFAAATGWQGGAHFKLTKRIPMGAGLGGGSSNAVAALRALNELTGHRLDASALGALAARLGSDCPLFLADGPVIMRGRGEQIEPLTATERARLTGQRMLIFKPSFGIGTPWAYAQLASFAKATDAKAASPQYYLPAAQTEARLMEWRRNPTAPLADFLFNSFEPVAFRKFIALPVLLEQLRANFGLTPRMSGSGSACFALLDAAAPVEAIKGTIRAAWGPAAIVCETTLR
jgi:4-diphosphocytidyl-2-C-methyl-D-erythritol kinase